MKKSILLIVLLLLSNFLLISQDTIFTETFEPPLYGDSVTSSKTLGVDDWGISAKLYYTGIGSDTCQVKTGSSTYLETDTIYLQGSQSAYLNFAHICKLHWQDAGEIEISINNGLTWTKLTGSEYLGTGTFGINGDRFNANSYPVDWNATIDTMVPTNSWWKTESFNISSLLSGASHVKIRFKLTDLGPTGPSNNYGWILDDIVVWIPTIGDAEIAGYILPNVPSSGCGLGLETVQMLIANSNAIVINQGFTASYQKMNGPIITETVNNNIYPGDTLLYTFTNKSDLSTTLDTNYTLNFWINVPNDTNQSNDSLQFTVLSRPLLPDPIISDTTVPYGSSITLTAAHLDSITWYSDSLGMNVIQTGYSYTTPFLYDTTTYYVQASRTGHCPSLYKAVHVNLSGIAHFDAGVTEITEPKGIVSIGIPYFMKVRIKNYGLNTINKVVIAWAINGIEKTPYIWTGSLPKDSVTSPINIGSQSFMSGTYHLSSWTTLPNDSNDLTNINDTSYSLLYTCLADTFTIGGVGADFNTIQDAIAILDTVGVCGNVVFNINPGTYAGNITLGPISGISNTNQITFQSSTGINTDVIIEYNATSASDNWVVLLDSTEWMNFRNLTLRANNATYANVVDLYYSNNNSFVNCILESTQSTSTDANCINVAGNLSNFNLFRKCKILNGNYGINYFGVSTTNLAKGNVIDDCEILNYQVYGIYSSFHDSLVIKNNTLRNYTVSPAITAYGIYNVNCDNGSNIIANDVHVIGMVNAFGVYVNNCDATTAVQGLIANNFISVFGSTGSNYGLYIANSNYQNIFYNSINVINGNTNSRSLFQTSGSNITILNNNISVDGGGFALYALNPSSIILSDYNNLYTEGFILAYWNGSMTTLANLQTNSGMDANSVSVDPGFIDSSDLHINNVALDGAATPLFQIGDDIDGNSRDALNPDIGADEYLLLIDDIGVTELIEPVDPCPGSPVDIKVRIKNFGTDTVFTGYIHWKVNGIEKDSIQFNYTMLGGDSIIVLLDTMSFSFGINYNLEFWTTNPNGNIDFQLSNDTLIVSNFKTALAAGNYSIGQGGGFDFTSFSEAVEYLESFGICGPVIFNIAAGTYNEQIELNQITGASVTNTITFQSVNGDSTSVILTYSPVVDTMNYVLKLWGADYIRIKKITIKSGGALGGVIEMGNGANYNQIVNNILESIQTTSPYARVINDKNTINKFNSILNNRILFGYYGIYSSGTNSTLREKGTVIKDNVILDFYYYGLYTFFQDSIEITGNVIDNSNSNSDTVYGVYCYYTSNAVVLKNNIHIQGNAIQFGVYLFNCNGSSSKNMLVGNNFISQMGGATTAYGLYHHNSNYVNYYFNSIHITGGSVSGSRAFFHNGGGNIKVVNNIFSNSAGGYAFYVSNPSAVVTSDYNDFITNGIHLAYWNSNKGNLSALQSASLKDIHSKSVDPYFTSNVDLHVNNGELFAAGLALTSLISDDIDGDFRDTLNPCIGADEFLLPPFDARVTTLFTLGKLPIDAGSPHVVSAIVENRGMNDLPGFNVYLNISGTNTFTDTLTIDTLYQGQKDTVYFDPYTPTVTGPNSVLVNIPADNINSDNVAMYYQLVTDSVFSYADTASKVKNVGFNTGSGLLLVKFHMNGIKLISSVNAFITDSNTLSKKLYAVMLDSAGNILSTSPVDTIDASQQETWVSFPILLTPATSTSDNDFYVGIAQTTGTTSCFPIGSQLEVPVRPGAYYTANLSGGSLVENPSLGRLMIEAVLTPPLTKNAKAVSFLSPNDGCGLTSNENVTLKVQNLGTDTIYGGDSTFTVSFMIDGNASSIVTEYVFDTLPPSTTKNHTFSNTADLSVSSGYNAFNFKGWVNQINDPFFDNDTTQRIVNSYFMPPPPSFISPITVQYGTSTILTASSNDSIYWYENQNDSLFLITGDSYIIPQLYDTTTYWLEARTGLGLIKITEITQFKTGIGATSPYPSWIAGNQSADFDGVEISNLGNVPVDLSGFTMNFYSSNTTYGVNGSWTFPNGISLLPGEVIVLDIKSTAGNDPMNNYYVLGLTGNLQSATQQCYYLKDKSGNIVDAVATNGASFPSSTGVTAADWLGSTSSSSGRAGITRVLSDNDVASDWVVAGTSISNQTVGSLNPQLISFLLGGQGCVSNRVPFVVQTTLPPEDDAGVIAITNPVGSALALTPVPVEIVIRNYGSDTLTSVLINYSVNGIMKQPFNWTGNLLKDSVSNPVVVAIDTFTGGYNCIKAWTSMPNGFTDTINDNDTIEKCFNACMSGTFTIGSGSSDFPTFHDAITSLDSAGICGPVTFNIVPGVYIVGQLVLKEITGVSETNTITFQSQSMDSTTVIIYGAATSDSNNFVLRLDGADFIHFKAVTIKTTNSTYPGVVELRQGANHNEFSNCVIESTGSSSSFAKCVYEDMMLNEYNVFRNNRILNGYYGIYTYGPSSSQLQKGITIDSNIIEGFSNYGLYVYYQDSILIRSNIITSAPAASNPRGIYLSNCNNGIKITGNNIKLSPYSQATGLFVTNCTGSFTTQGLIANNFISINGGQISATSNGINCSNTVYQNFYFNTVSINDSSTNSRCVYQALGNNINYINNIFANTGGGFTYYVTSPASIISADYNDLYATGTFLAYWNGNQLNLSALQTASSKEANSVSINPEFVSVSDLHVGNFGLDGTGTPIYSIVTDIDGEIRDLNSPDVGADEFTPSSFDAGISNVVAPVSIGQVGNQDVIVKLVNYGIDTLTYLSVNWSVNGIIQNPYSWSGILATGEFIDSLTIGQYNFPVGETSIVVWTSSPNGNMDDFLYNDTTSAIIISCSGQISGVYTIGGTNPDFTSFTNAYYALSECYINGQVTFNVAPGTYNEQLILTQVTGVSPTNRIIFQGATGDSTDVILKFSPNTSANNFIVYLNGADYVTFKNMTIKSTSDTVFGRVVVLDDGADFNEFSNNTIESIVSSENTSACFYSDGFNDGYLEVKNNRILHGYYGFYLVGVSTSNLEQGISIEDNQITGFHAYGGYFLFQDGINLSGNYVKNDPLATNTYGFYLHSCNNDNFISKNNIILDGANSNFSLFMKYCDGTLGQMNTVVNNFLSITGTSISNNYGIYYDSSHFANFYYNSVNIATGSANSADFYMNSDVIQGNPDVNILNNNFMNSSGGFTYYFDLINVALSDNNNLYTTGNNLANWNGIANNLAALQTLSNKDTNSISVYPGFISATDLHITLNSINGQGVPIPSVTDDIDGDIRNQNLPDIGADEFTLNVLDVGVSTFLEPSDSYSDVGTLKDVKVLIKNYGTNTVSNFNVGYKVKGNVPVIEIFTDTLSGNEVDTFLFVTKMNPVPGDFDLCVFTSITGDQNGNNDTICAHYFGIPTILSPYTEDFENMNNFWYSSGQNNEWEFGLPVASTINSAHSPSHAWATNLNGNYQNNSLEYLYSPKFDISIYGIGYLRFWHWYSTESPSDIGKVQYMNNQENWITLGVQNDSVALNWYNSYSNGDYGWSGNSNGWKQSEYDLVGLNDLGNIVQFRFVFETNSTVFNYDGWAIDDFEITPPKLPEDAGIVSILSPVDTTVLGTTVTVEVKINNFGSDTLTDIPLSYVLDNGMPVNEIYSDTLIPNASAVYTFNSTFPAPTVSSYSLCAFTNIVNDTNFFNDTICEFLIKKLPDYDVGVEYIVSPVDSTLWDTNYTVKVRIKNYGIKKITSIPLVYIYDTNAPVVETWTGSLPAGYSVNYFFNQTIDPGQGYKASNLCLYTSLPNDGYPVNDTVCDSLYNVPVGMMDNELEGFILGQNIPNPTNKFSTINFTIPESGEVHFMLMNVLGNLIYESSNKTSAGIHQIELDVSTMPSGVYYYSLEYKGRRLVKKMVVNK
ncbi:T9SS type A sorting domain-containing protein [candidate division KSB1 bacterium]